MRRKNILKISVLLLAGILIMQSAMNLNSSKADSVPEEGQVVTATIQDMNAPWGEEDFHVEGTKVTGLSNFGKAKLANKNKLEIPEVMKGYTINTIGKDAFKNLASMEDGKGFSGELVLPKTITLIEDSAFENAGLTGEIHLHESLSRINPKAFKNNKITVLTLPDNIGPVGPEAFMDNEIEKLNLGALTNIQGARWGVEHRPYDPEYNYENRGMLSYNLFRNNKIKEIVFPQSSVVWGIGCAAFQNNKIEELMVPAKIQNIHFYAFKDNKNLKTVTFEEGRTGSVQIDRGAFENGGIEGHLIYPEGFGSETGGRAFAENKITEVTFPNKAMINGYFSFEKNPLVSINSLNPAKNFLEIGAFRNTRTLKNVSFFYNTEGNRFTHITDAAFRNGKLRSINIPDYVTKVTDNIDMESFTYKAVNIGSAFEKNTGWYPGEDNSVSSEKSKVALYRVDGSGNYVTDNALTDGNFYTVNPVLLKLNIVDQNGNVLDKEVTLVGARHRGSEVSNVTLTEKENFTDFKLGDQFSFGLPEIEGLKILGASMEGEHSAALSLDEISKEYRLDFNPNFVTEKAYGDGYRIGYKELVFNLRYEVPVVNTNTTYYEPVFPSLVSETTPQSPAESLPGADLDKTAELSSETNVEKASESEVKDITEVTNEASNQDEKENTAEILEETVVEGKSEEMNEEAGGAEGDVEIIPIDEDTTPLSEIAMLPNEKEVKKGRTEKAKAEKEEIIEMDEETLPKGEAEIMDGKKDGKKNGKKAVLAMTGGLESKFLLYSMALLCLVLLAGGLHVFRKKQ